MTLLHYQLVYQKKLLRNFCATDKQATNCGAYKL